MKEEKKGREGNGEDSLDLLTRKNFLATPLQKKSVYYLQKVSVPEPTAWKTFVTQISTPLQILNTPRNL